MDDIQREINRLKSVMRNWSYGRLKAEMETTGWSLKKGAAAELIHEIDQAHTDEILERHHVENLAQGERHNREELEQQRKQFNRSIQAIWIAMIISLVAAVAAWGAVWCARIQTAAQIAAAQKEEHGGTRRETPAPKSSD